MKKRRILLGLALAAAAVFSLTSCGDDTKPADNGGSQVTPEQGGGSGTQTQKYSVTYHTEHGTAPTALSDVNALPTDLPTLTDADYNFGGWATTENGTTPVTGGTAITSNTDLYAIWTAKTLYEKISTKDGKLIATQFGSDTQIKGQNAYEGQVGFYDYSDGDDCSVVIQDGKAKLVDTGSHTAKLNADFGFIFDGIIEGTLKYTPNNTTASTLNGGWNWIQFCGYQDFRSEPETYFAIRTDGDKKINFYFTSECGKDSQNKTTYQFKATNPITYANGTEYEIYWKYDFSTKKITVTVNGAELVTDLAVPTADQPIFLNNLLFITAGSDTARSATIDDFAIANINTGDLATTKEYFNSLLDATMDGMDLVNDYSFFADAITGNYQQTVTNINAATTREGALAAFLNTTIFSYSTNAEYKATIKDGLDNFKNIMASNYTVNATAFNDVFTNAKAAIDAATTKAAVDAASEGVTNDIQGVKSDNTIRGEALIEYSTYAYQQYATLDSSAQSNASQEFNQLNATYVGTSGDGLLSTCAATDIATTLSTAKGEIDALITKYSMTLDQYKSKLETDLTTAKTELLADYDETVDADLFAAVEAIELDWTNVDTKEKALEEYNNKITSINNAKDSYDLAKEKSTKLALLVVSYQNIRSEFSDAAAIASIDTNYDAIVQLINNATTVSEVDSIYETESDKLQKDYYNAALQIELNNREDVQISKTVTKGDWDCAALSTSLGSNTVLTSGTYAERFIFSGNDTKAKDDSGVKTISFKASRITFTTYTANATLVLTAASGNAKRLIALDEDITSQGQQSSNWTNTDTKKKLETTTTFTIATPGTHYITFDNTEHKLTRIELNDSTTTYINSKLDGLNPTLNLNLEYGATIADVLSSVTGTVYYDSNNDGVIDGDDLYKDIELDKANCIVKLYQNDTEVTTLTSGDYEVVVIYGDGTNVTRHNSKKLSEQTITVAAQKHTVTINGTEYKIEDGQTLGDKLPASATKADEVSNEEIITKYTFVGWEDANHNPVYSSTVVTSDMVISPVFSSSYCVNTFDGLLNIISVGEDAFSLDANIALTSNINVDYALILETNSYSLSGPGKFILDTNGEIICDSDISAFIESIDNLHMVKETINSGEYTYNLVEFTGIEGYYTVSGNVVTLDAVKLIPNGSTSESEYVEITSGYTATLIDLTNSDNHNFGTSLPDGGYRITVTYESLSFTKMFDIGGVD